MVRQLAHEPWVGGPHHRNTSTPITDRRADRRADRRDTSRRAGRPREGVRWSPGPIKAGGVRRLTPQWSIIGARSWRSCGSRSQIGAAVKLGKCPMEIRELSAFPTREPEFIRREHHLVKERLPLGF